MLEIKLMFPLLSLNKQTFESSEELGIALTLWIVFVENEVCPDTEHKKINSGTADTEKICTKRNNTTEDTE